MRNDTDAEIYRWRCLVAEEKKELQVLHLGQEIFTLKYYYKVFVVFILVITTTSSNAFLLLAV